MKRIVGLAAVVMLICAMVPCAHAAYSHYSDKVTVADDVKGFVITAWSDEPFMLDDIQTAADMLIIEYVGSDYEKPKPEEITSESMSTYADEAWHWAEENRGYGDFVVCKTAPEDFLRFSYDGTSAEPDTADDSFYDYTSKLYAGNTEGQVKRIFVPQSNRQTAYIKYFCGDTGTHNALRVEWLPNADGSEGGSWAVSNFYADNARDFNEAEVCARFGYYDYCVGHAAEMKSTGLNVRNNPNGEIIGLLEKGAAVTVYRHEEPGDNGYSYTLIHKASDPDENGNSYIEYYGWVAGEFLNISNDWHQGRAD